MPVVAEPVIHPIETPAPASHLVKASWYGPGLNGRKTSSGEAYDPRALTAASRTLPIDSVVKVTNPQNGKSVNVRINDRGPFVSGRSLDLSQRAAETIGVIDKGVARVKVSRTTLTSRPRDRKGPIARSKRHNGKLAPAGSSSPETVGD
jgi:rare lipoprotein A